MNQPPNTTEEKSKCCGAEPIIKPSYSSRNCGMCVAIDITRNGTETGQICGCGTHYKFCSKCDKPFIPTPSVCEVAKGECTHRQGHEEDHNGNCYFCGLNMLTPTEPKKTVENKKALQYAIFKASKKPSVEEHLKEEEKIVKGQKSSRKQVEFYAQLILNELGIDTTEVNLKEDGIGIYSFKLLVKKLYDLGYSDGEEQYAHAKILNRQMEEKGIKLKKHKKVAFKMANMEK